jgi:hypothetical protein
MANIEQAEWCTCEPKVEKDGNEYPPMGQINLLRMLSPW